MNRLIEQVEELQNIGELINSWATYLKREMKYKEILVLLKKGYKSKFDGHLKNYFILSFLHLYLDRNVVYMENYPNDFMKLT
jgi:hypothetical protein